jgi:glycosyltransferase involved in cell wall biosynthesis
MKYSVVIPTYNHCDDLLKPCIESIFKYTNLADIELIISANGCKDNTSQYLDELRYKFNQLNLANHL